MTIYGNGTVHGISTQGQNYSCANASCPPTPFGYGDKITLTATPDWKSLFIALGSACDGSANTCVVTLTADRNVFALFSPNFQVRVPNAWPTDYATIQDGYDHSADGSTIFAQVNTFYEDLLFDRAMTVTINGGKDGSYMDAAGYSTVRGSITLGQGAAIVGNLIVW